MNSAEALKLLKTWKYFPQADYYFQCQTHMNIASYVEEYEVPDLKKYLIADWKKGMDDLYFDYEYAERKRKFHWAVATAGHYGEDALKEAKLTAVLDGDDGWHDE
jgi:hypothetical protein